MNAHTAPVLRVNSVQEEACYLDAVAVIIRDIQREYDITLQDISESIDVSLKTISNAANKKGVLCVTFLKRLGECFGAQFLDPWAALSGGRMVPLQPNQDDPMPALLSLATALCRAKAEGREHDHRVKLAMVPDLKAAQAAITNMILQAEAFRA